MNLYLAFQCFKGVDKHPIRFVQVRELAQLHGHVSGVALREPQETGEITGIQGRKPRNTQRKVFCANRKLNEATVYATENAAHRRRVREKRRPINAVLLGHVQSPREEGVIHNACDGGGSLAVLVYELRQGPGTVGSERGEEELNVVVGLHEAGSVEAVGDGFDGDVWGGDGVGGVVGGGDGGFYPL